MIWTSMEILSLLYHRLQLCSASRPNFSGICRFDVNNSEPSSFIDIKFVQVIKIWQLLGPPKMQKVSPIVLSRRRI